MKRMFVVLTFLLGLMLSTASLAGAQGTTTVDIAEIAEVVLEADPAAVTEGLATPPDDEDLPEGFFNPPSGTPEHADVVEAFTGEIADIEGTIGNVSHPFDTDTSVVPGLLSAGVITYLVTQDEITSDDLDDFEEGAAEGFEGQTEGVEGTVERVETAGADSVLITVITEQQDVMSVVQIIAMPVGNTMVVGTVVVADQGDIDPADVLPFAEDLTVAGAEHLGAVAEES